MAVPGAAEGRKCSNCATDSTPRWYHGEESSWLCDTCWQYWWRTGKARPAHLWKGTKKGPQQTHRNAKSSRVKSARSRNGSSASSRSSAGEGASVGSLAGRRSRAPSEKILDKKFRNQVGLIIPRNARSTSLAGRSAHLETLPLLLGTVAQPEPPPETSHAPCTSSPIRLETKTMLKGMQNRRCLGVQLSVATMPTGSPVDSRFRRGRGNETWGSRRRTPPRRASAIAAALTARGIGTVGNEETATHGCAQHADMCSTRQPTWGASAATARLTTLCSGGAVKAIACCVTLVGSTGGIVERPARRSCSTGRRSLGAGAATARLTTRLNGFEVKTAAGCAMPAGSTGGEPGRKARSS